jgi:hypothetical protein
MARNRRTKKQKIAASVRQTPLVITTSGGQTHISVNSVSDSSTVSTPSHNFSTPSHTYVARDIRYTLAVTTLLVLADLAIYFLLKLRFVNIPGIGF